jgi:hypothetical protein
VCLRKRHERNKNTHQRKMQPRTIP